MDEEIDRFDTRMWKRLFSLGRCALSAEHDSHDLTGPDEIIRVVTMSQEVVVFGLE
jgi:hypothetical protein